MILWANSLANLTMAKTTPQQGRWGPPRQITPIMATTLLLVSLYSFLYSILVHGRNPNNIDDESQYPLLLQHIPAVKWSTSLIAYRESYEFFDDITESSWMLMKQRAQNSVLSSDPSEIGQNYLTEGFLYHLQPDFTCPHVRHVGTTSGEYRKWTCDPHRLQKSSDCLIYSIGSTRNYVWEDSLIKILGDNQCEIHVIDSFGDARVADPQQKNIHLHKWAMQSCALSESATASGMGADRLSFPEIVERLGHGNRTIDILKLDCEECAWLGYPDWIGADVRQILISTRGIPSIRDSSPGLDHYFSGFTENNFAMFSKDTNVHGDRDISFDFGFLKLHPDFWGRAVTKNTVKEEDVLQRQFLPPIVLDDHPPAPYTIPKRLIFVYPANVMVSEDPYDIFLNVGHTIAMLKLAWKQEEISMWFVDDFTCLATINEVKPELVSVYRSETDAAKQIDMCRVAALYRSGGYYFGVGFKLKASIVPADDSSLLVARLEKGGLSRQFMACEPRSIVMEMTLDAMVKHSQRNESRSSVDEAFMQVFSSLDPSVKPELLNLNDIGSEINPDWSLSKLPPGGFANPVPLNMRDSPLPDYKIPRRIVFTYKESLLETKKPFLFYNNVQRTIRTYREAWGEADAPVWFLNDTDCRAAIYAAKPELVPYFDHEVHGSWKADICRVAALYLTGGYYFDVDMEVIEPWMHNANVSFATVRVVNEERLFQSFIASEKEGRVLKKALSEMLLFYEKKRPRQGSLLGPDTMRWAFESVPVSERGRCVFLEEAQFPLKEAATPERRNAVGLCNFAVRDLHTDRHVFYSRLVGTPWCRAGSNSSESERASGTDIAAEELSS